MNKVNLDTLNMQIDSIVRDMRQNFEITKSSNINISLTGNTNNQPSVTIESLLKQEKK